MYALNLNSSEIPVDENYQVSQEHPTVDFPFNADLLEYYLIANEDFKLRQLDSFAEVALTRKSSSMLRKSRAKFINK